MPRLPRRPWPRRCKSLFAPASMAMLSSIRAPRRWRPSATTRSWRPRTSRVSRLRPPARRPPYTQPDPTTPDGACYPGSKLSFNNFAGDGTSHTIIVVETIEPRCARWTYGKEQALVGLPTTGFTGNGAVTFAQVTNANYWCAHRVHSRRLRQLVDSQQGFQDLHEQRLQQHRQVL